MQKDNKTGIIITITTLALITIFILLIYEKACVYRETTNTITKTNYQIKTIFKTNYYNIITNILSSYGFEITNILTNETILITNQVEVEVLKTIKDVKEHSVLILGNRNLVGIGYTKTLGEFLNIQWSIGGGILVYSNGFDIYAIIKADF